MEWTYESIMTAGNEMMNSATKIDQLINTFGELIESITRNYDSPKSRELIEKFKRIKELGPEFNAEVTGASKKLTDEVAPAYAKVEQKNQMI